MSANSLLKSLAVVVTLGGLSISSVSASSIILDGTFKNPIGVGSDLRPWSDWTDAGIATHSAPAGTPGDYASLPVGADLFQRFSPLHNGLYELSFLVRNESSSPAVLVFAVQEALGTPISIVFDEGTAEELILPVSKLFQHVTLDFTLDNPPFTPNELTFSNSYDAPIAPITNSKNPAETVIDVAGISLVALSPTAVPEPRTWVMLLIGMAAMGVLGRGRRRRLRGRRTDFMRWSEGFGRQGVTRASPGF
jgi:hypothetical protein